MCAAESGAVGQESPPHGSDLAFLLDRWSSISEATRQQLLALVAADIQPPTP